jgi:hypothetical protein
MRVTTILMVVAAAARPVYVAVLSLPMIVAAARTMLVAVLSVRVLVAVLVLGLRHVRRVAGVPPPRSPSGRSVNAARTV